MSSLLVVDLSLVRDFLHRNPNKQAATTITSLGESDLDQANRTAIINVNRYKFDINQAQQNHPSMSFYSGSETSIP